MRSMTTLERPNKKVVLSNNPALSRGWQVCGNEMNTSTIRYAHTIRHVLTTDRHGCVATFALEFLPILWRGVVVSWGRCSVGIELAQSILILNPRHTNLVSSEAISRILLRRFRSNEIPDNHVIQVRLETSKANKKSTANECSATRAYCLFVSKDKPGVLMYRKTQYSFMLMPSSLKISFNYVMSHWMQAEAKLKEKLGLYLKLMISRLGIVAIILLCQTFNMPILICRRLIAYVIAMHPPKMVECRREIGRVRSGSCFSCLVAVVIGSADLCLLKSIFAKASVERISRPWLRRVKSPDAGMPTRLLDFPSELLVVIAEFLPPVQRSRSLPSLCRAMYEAELMSWSCQVSKTSVLVGRQAKTTCVKRSLSPQKAVRQAILRKSDSILLKIIYIDSVFSIMAHTILAKAIELQPALLLQSVTVAASSSASTSCTRHHGKNPHCRVKVNDVRREKASLAEWSVPVHAEQQPSERPFPTSMLHVCCSPFECDGISSAIPLSSAEGSLLEASSSCNSHAHRSHRCRCQKKVLSPHLSEVISG
ncbi:hypothetical protein KCU66_g58, partial [Aureobasidium melanogenum]